MHFDVFKRGSSTEIGFRWRAKRSWHKNGVSYHRRLAISAPFAIRRTFKARPLDDNGG